MPWFVNWSARCPKNKSDLMPKPCWMPGASCFKTKPINIKLLAFSNPMSVLSPKAKPLTFLNLAAKSRFLEPLTVELFLEHSTLPGYLFDDNTVQAVLKQIKRLIGKHPEIHIADRSYKGQKEFCKIRLLTPSVPLKTDSQYDQRKQRKRFRKRAELKVTISHSKQHFRMGKFYLKRELGDHKMLYYLLQPITSINGSDLR